MRGQPATNPSQEDVDDLQKQYRMMEVSRKTNSNDQSQTLVRMQQQQIDKLKKDNDRLKEDLALETRQAKQANNMSASAQISKLQDQADMYNRKTALEGKKIEELTRQLVEIQNDLLVQKKTMGGINAAQEKDQHVLRQIRVRESRLDKALVKYNEATAYNTKLNQTIGNLRRERVVFDGIHKKLERELQEKKKQMAEIIETTNAAYEARDKAHAEMVLLKADADKQQEKFEEEWSQLGQMIENDRRMKDKSLRPDHEENISGKIDPVYEEEAKLRIQVSKGYGSIQQNKADIHLSMEKVQSYEEAFAKIQKATKITDIDELVQAFTQSEDQNFSLFNYVNELSNEIEQLEERIESLQEEVKKYQLGGADGTIRAKKLIVSSLTETLTESDDKAKSYVEQVKTTEVSMSTLQTGIMALFDKVGCKDAQLKDALSNSGVTEGNMMQFLGVIEKRVEELISIYQSEQSTDDKDWETPFDENTMNGEEGEEGAEAPGVAKSEPVASVPEADEGAAEAAEEPAAEEDAGEAEGSAETEGNADE